MDRHQENVIRTVEESDIRFVRLWFADVLGTLKSVAISPVELEAAFTEGIGIDGSTLEGFTRVYESDMILRPDASTFRLLPWRGTDPSTARMMCDVLTPDGEPSGSDPRGVLKRMLRTAADRGFEFFTHPEIEFYMFYPLEDGKPPRPMDQGGYFDHVHRAADQDFRRRTIGYLEDMGIAVEFSHHENGPGQNEIDLRYADALTTADNIITFRTVVKEVALSMGYFASFMPKPLAGKPGSGMHTHLSLFQDGENAFHEPGAEYGLSRVARQFVAGLLTYAPEYAAVTNQYVNSYKRLWGGQEAPSFICWGHNNRSALVRVPFHKPSKADSSRVEFRGLDVACNPYLAFAVLLGAGLKGIEDGLELPEGAEDDVWELSPDERRALGFEPLPADLIRAVGRFKESELMADVLGEEAFAYLLRNKEAEWQKYQGQVTPWELAHYLPTL